MTVADQVTPDSKAPAPANTPVVVRGTPISSTNGSRTPHPSSDHQSQRLLNEVSVRLERLSLETEEIKRE